MPGTTDQAGRITMLDNRIVEMINSGLHLIPLQKDKSPAKGWLWRDIVPTVDDLDGMPSDFIGLACGDGIEAIDFDLKYDLTGTLFNDYCNLVKAVDEDILFKLVVQKTMNKGYHFVYRCEEIEGNKKLARRPASKEELLEDPMDKLRVLIETRGVGGYIAVAPSPGYRLSQNSFTDIPFITIEERNLLLSTARSFDQIHDVDPAQKKYDRESKTEWVGGKSPFEDYNDRGDMLSVLFEYGWAQTGTTGKISY